MVFTRAARISASALALTVNMDWSLSLGLVALVERCNALREESKSGRCDFIASNKLAASLDVKCSETDFV